MKAFKALSSVVLVSMTALVITASALAESTALCTAHEDPCAEENQITHVHLATLPGARVKIKLSFPFPNVECSVLFLGDAELPLETTLSIEGAFTYTNCNNSCTVTEENGPTAIAILKTGTEVAWVGLGGGEMHIKCATDCSYSIEVIATGKGPLLSSELDGEIWLEEQEMPWTKGLSCPLIARLSITTTPSSATYIAS